MAKVGRDLWRSSSSNSLSSRATYSQLPRTLLRWLLNISKGGESTTSLCNLFWCSITFTVKKCFLISRHRTFCVSVCAHCLSPCHWAHLKRAWLHLYILWVFIHIGKICLSFLFFRLNGPSSPSLSSYERCLLARRISHIWEGCPKKVTFYYPVKYILWHQCLAMQDCDAWITGEALQFMCNQHCLGAIKPQRCKNKIRKSNTV